MPDRGRPARILLVDDEEAILEMLTTLLETDGHEVATAHDGNEALDRLRRERFELVITDKNLPGPSGLDIIRAATEADPLVECMLVTGYGSLESAIAAMEAGAFDYILKPFSSIGELRSKVSRALERQRLKADNRSLLDFLSAVIRNMSSCLIVVDREGRLRAINPPALATAGLSLADAPEGKPLTEVLAPEVAKAFLVPSERVNGQTIPREIALLRKDGKRIGVGYSCTPLLAESGTDAAGSVITFRDLSELKRAQEEEKRRDRLAALGEMSARIAHEVRNPLVSIDSVLRLLEEDMKENASAHKDLETIGREVRRLHGIVSEILQFARPARTTRSKGDLLSLVRSALSQVQPQFKGKEIALQSSLPERLEPVPHDPERLRQVLLNVLLNALDATPQGGKVSLTLAPMSGASGALAGVRLTVEDTGHGIPGEVESKLFTPFFSTKTRGTGLGLAISRGIVEEHQGKISLRNRAAGGACLEIVLPAEGPPP